MGYNAKVYRKQGGNELVVASGGLITVEPGGLINVMAPPGSIYFVNSAVTASGAGTSWSTAFKTITEAMAVAVAGDTILIKGSFTAEPAVTVSVAGLSLIGVGTTSNQALWTSPADAKSLIINAADCLVQNIRFRPPAYSSGVPAAISLSAANQAKIVGCRFQGKTGSYVGILTDGNNSNVHIEDCDFFYLNNVTTVSGTAILGSGYTVGENSGWLVRNCRFHSNINHINCRMRQSFIIGNYFAAGGLAADSSNSATLTVLGVDIHGATGGNNVVTQNFMGSLYHQACYYGGTNDDWSGNFVTDRTHATQVDATTGLSKVAPAA
jgi:hypothetical protein